MCLICYCCAHIIFPDAEQLWVLDSVPGEGRLENSYEVEKILKVLQSLPSSLPSGKYVISRCIKFQYNYRIQGIKFQNGNVQF